MTKDKRFEIVLAGAAAVDPQDRFRPALATAVGCMLLGKLKGHIYDHKLKEIAVHIGVDGSFEMGARTSQLTPKQWAGKEITS